MAHLDERHLPDLDEIVLSALDLFSEGLPGLDVAAFRRPLVVGSGNAAATGRILFSGKDAVFADESTYRGKLSQVDGVVIISASGAKHAPVIAKEVIRRKIPVVLVTNTEDSPAARLLPKKSVVVLPKQPEPYTYNTSTYMSAIIAQTREDPQQIKKFILQKVKPKIPRNLRRYSAFYLILPEEFDVLREMLRTKFDELFGPMVVGRIFTLEQTKHAKTVVPSDKELFISFGVKNSYYGRHKLYIPLPKNASYAAAMAITYYFIGNIQKQHPPYFKKHITQYLKQASKIFKSKLSVVVE